MTEKLMFLENQMKFKNLKLRRLPEGAEGETELRAFMTSWPAAQMQLEDSVAPLLDSAYRLGSQRRSPNALPRDILIRCADMRTKQKILFLSRSRGHLLHMSYKIQVLQDLLFETLEARRKLRPLTSLLLREKIKYCLQAFAKVQVLHKGASLLAYDDDSEVSMLEALGLEIPDGWHRPKSPERHEN